MQEHTLNDIAQRVSRLHGQVLDADSPESGAGEADIAIPSLVARTGDQPLARENELIKELRVTGLNESYPEQRRQFARWFAFAPPVYGNGAAGWAAGTRRRFCKHSPAGQPVKVIATMSAEGAMHLGHGALAQLLVYFQSLGAQIVIGFRDGGAKSPRGRRPAGSVRGKGDGGAAGNGGTAADAGRRRPGAGADGRLSANRPRRHYGDGAGAGRRPSR